MMPLAGLAPRRRPRLTSNYKGFPVCQAQLTQCESRQRFTLRHSNFDFVGAGVVKRALNSGKGCGLEELQPVIDAVITRLRTLMKDARGASIR